MVRSRIVLAAVVLACSASAVTCASFDDASGGRSSSIPDYRDARFKVTFDYVATQNGAPMIEGEETWFQSGRDLSRSDSAFYGTGPDALEGTQYSTTVQRGDEVIECDRSTEQPESFCTLTDSTSIPSRLFDVVADAVQQTPLFGSTIERTIAGAPATCHAVKALSSQNEVCFNADGIPVAYSLVGPDATISFTAKSVSADVDTRDFEFPQSYDSGGELELHDISITPLP